MQGGVVIKDSVISSIVNKSLILKRFRTFIACSNTKRLNEICAQLLLEIPLGIAKFRQTQYSGFFFEFPNGSIIDVFVIRAENNFRGKRIHNLFVDSGIDGEIVDVVLKPMLTSYVDQSQIEFI